MFWRKKKDQATINELVGQVHALTKIVEELNVNRAVQRATSYKFQLPKNDELNLARFEMRIARLENPQKFKGVVMYKGKKYEVLSTNLAEVAPNEYTLYDMKNYEIRYTLVYREGNELKQIFDIPERELSKNKGK